MIPIPRWGELTREYALPTSDTLLSFQFSHSFQDGPSRFADSILQAMIVEMPVPFSCRCSAATNPFSAILTHRLSLEAIDANSPQRNRRVNSLDRVLIPDAK